MRKKHLLKRISSTMALMMAAVSALVYSSPPKTGQAASTTAWTKVDGVFVNSSGNEIEGAVLKGIDVSYHNKDIDWEAVKASDIDYAILRCGYGQDYESQDDQKWEEYADACTELGIPFGTYLYSYATTVSAAKSEAEHVLRLIEGYQLTYPVYYDMEDSKQAGTTAKRKAQMAEAFCTIIEDAGYQVGIYANTDWFTNKLTDSYFETRDKWVAQYNATCKYTGAYRMWQCTSSGTVPGITTKTDLNFWFEQAPPYQGNTPSSSAASPGNSAVTPPENTPAPGDTNQGTQTPGTETPGTETPGTNNGQTGTTPPENNDKQPTDTNQTGTENPSTAPSESNNGTNNDNANNNTNTEPGNPGTIVTKPSDESNTDKDNQPVTPPEPLTLSQELLELSYGGTSVLTANLPVTWSSSDDEIITISAKGKVMPTGVGEAVITAETSSGETAECQVTVKKPIKDTAVQEIPDQQFTGSQIRPLVTVMDNEKILTKGTDYKLSYANNMGKGTATITLKGKGYYTGNTKVTFRIIPKEKLPVPVVTSLSSKKNVVTLKWKKVSKASGYEIYRAIGKGGEYTLQKTITKKSKVSYKDKKLSKGKKYYYKIRSYQLVDGQKKYSTYAKVNIKA